MAVLNKINVGGQDYDISVPDGSSLSLSSLTITGGLTVEGTATLPDVTCGHTLVESLSVIGGINVTSGVFGSPHGYIRFFASPSTPYGGLIFSPGSTASTNRTWVLQTPSNNLTLSIEGSVSATGKVSCSDLRTASITVDGAPSRIGLRGQSSYDAFIEYDNTEDALSLGFSSPGGGETAWNMYINHAGTSGGIDLNGGSLTGATTIQTGTLYAPVGSPLTLSVGGARMTYSLSTYRAYTTDSFVSDAVVETYTNTTLSINDATAASQLIITNTGNKAIKIIPSSSTRVWCAAGTSSRPVYNNRALTSTASVVLSQGESYTFTLAAPPITGTNVRLSGVNNLSFRMLTETISM